MYIAWKRECYIKAANLYFIFHHLPSLGWHILFSKKSCNNVVCPHILQQCNPGSVPSRVRVSGHSFWSWAGLQDSPVNKRTCWKWCCVRLGQKSAVLAFISWNNQLSAVSFQETLPGTQLSCCDKPKEHGNTPCRHAGQQILWAQPLSHPNSSISHLSEGPSRWF